MYRPSSSMVDYTERRKTEREKSFCMFYITCGPPQREEVLCEKEKIKFLSIMFYPVRVIEENVDF